MNKNIINILYFFIVLYLIYIFYKDYTYNQNNKDSYITCADDFEKNLHNYSESELYNKMNNLSDNDKKFLNDYIIYTMIKHKSEKPNLNKKINTLKYDILTPSVIASCINFSLAPGMNVFRHNILQHFTTKIF